MLFDTRRQMRRLSATCFHYEDQLMKKNTQIRETEELLRDLRGLLEVTEECNDALARENLRISENKDFDKDLMEWMYAENNEAVRKMADVARLEDENYRLWVENTLLKAELAVCRPERAYEIGRSR